MCQINQPHHLRNMKFFLVSNLLKVLSLANTLQMNFVQRFKAFYCDIVKRQQIEIGVLYKASERVKSLLANPNLDLEEYKVAKDNLELLKNILHPMSVFGNMYNFEPFSPSSEKINLGIK